MRGGGTAAVCLGDDDDGGGEKLGVVCELKSHAAAEELKIRAAITDKVMRVHGIEVAALVFLEAHELPKTTSGKVQRGEAKKLLLAAPKSVAAAAIDFVPTDVPAWQKAAQALIFAQMRALGATPLLDKPLFAHGLDSLAMLGMKGDLEEALSRSFDITLLARAPTLAAGLQALFAASAQTRAAALRLSAGACTPAETGIYLWQSEHPHADALVMRLQLHFARPQEHRRLERALETLCARHPGLRARFVFAGGAAQRRVQQAASVPWCKEDALARPFALADEAPFRVCLSGDGKTLALAFHHIAFDTDAICVFFAEFDACVRGTALPPPPAERRPAGHISDANKDTFIARAKTALGTLALRPHASPRKGVVRVAHAFDASATQTLKARAALRGHSLFTTIATAFSLALDRAMSERDFAIGTSAQTRPHGAQMQIASFANIVPVWLQLPRAEGFSACAEHVHQALHAALARREFPYREAVAHMHAPLRALIHQRQARGDVDPRWNEIAAGAGEQVQIFGICAAIASCARGS